MRSLLITAAIVLTLSACATQTPAPAPAPAPVPAPAAAAPAPAPKAPECYNGDAGKFEAIGAKSTISGVKVTCEKTSDGKSGQWMGAKK